MTTTDGAGPPNDASPLPRAGRVLAAGTWEDEPADRVSLSFEARHEARLRLEGEAGLVFVLDLPDAPSLSDGDGLALDDGRIVAVSSAAEALLEVTATEPDRLAWFAWHLGKRHLPVQLGDDTIRIREEQGLAEMLEGLGATVRRLEAPFHPEAGTSELGPAGAADHLKGHAHLHRHPYRGRGGHG